MTWEFFKRAVLLLARLKPPFLVSLHSPRRFSRSLQISIDRNLTAAYLADGSKWRPPSPHEGIFRISQSVSL
jgi:hypothetical protein